MSPTAFVTGPRWISDIILEAVFRIQKKILYFAFWTQVIVIPKLVVLLQREEYN